MGQCVCVCLSGALWCLHGDVQRPACGVHELGLTMHVFRRVSGLVYGFCSCIGRMGSLVSHAHRQLSFC